MTATETTALLQSVRTSTATVLAELSATTLSDSDVRAASLLPDWTIGHVLTHLARSADAMAGSVGGTLRDEAVALYPDGDEGRAKDIEAGAGRHATEIVADLRDSAERLDRVLGAVADADAWDRVADRGLSNEEILISRWCEIEIHRIDARLAVPKQWPAQFVERMLRETADPARLPERLDRPVRIVVDGGTEPALTGLAVDVAPAGGDDAPVEVRAPDFAVLAWLFGRGSAVDPPLGSSVVLTPWRRIPAAQ
ncbi:MAG: maleylpyruvate isomerase family mycothiol-dependent enzyme [Jatrophihabitans sp.]